MLFIVLSKKVTCVLGRKLHLATLMKLGAASDLPRDRGNPQCSETQGLAPCLCSYEGCMVREKTWRENLVWGALVKDSLWDH
jgi:hypothetical protein